MPYRYSMYLRYIHYNKILDAWWYDDLKKKLNILEEHKININISELNRYLYQRYVYENGDSNEFDDTKYNLENYMQIIEYKKLSGYKSDDEITHPIDHRFVRTMDTLSEKLASFSLQY